MAISESSVRAVVSNALNLTQEEIDRVKEDDDLRNTGLNSVTSIELIVKLEEEWSISIADEDLLIENVSTLQKVIELLEKYVCDKSA